MEFFQLVMVIYNEIKGNKKKLKKRKEKKNSNRINKLGVSEIKYI